MIAVNELIQDAYQGIGMTGLGESTGEFADDNLPVIGCKELNHLIAELNGQGYLSLTQKAIELNPRRTYVFKKLREGEEAAEGVVDMDPPQAVAGVMRKIGVRYIPLHSIDPQQLQMRNLMTIPCNWNYSRDIETWETDLGEVDGREVGILELDGRPNDKIKVFYNMPLPKYELDGKIFLPDLYHSMLLSGLKYKLACFHKLSEQDKADALTDFNGAKTLIKRNAITQRMMREEPTGGSYLDSYYNAFAPAEW